MINGSEKKNPPVWHPGTFIHPVISLWQKQLSVSVCLFHPRRYSSFFSHTVGLVSRFFFLPHQTTCCSIVSADFALIPSTKLLLINAFVLTLMHFATCCANIIMWKLTTRLKKKNASLFVCLHVRACAACNFFPSHGFLRWSLCKHKLRFPEMQEDADKVSSICKENKNVISF